ncbi:MAG: aminotransferase class V-fold PLP-dependent enzyme [Flavobacteriales bacterium]|nr:aminotransferase class V-fold PLP-dependent enzyme [Flavobacteriales bacterium]
MTSRRNFFAQASALAGAVVLPSILNNGNLRANSRLPYSEKSAEELVTDEDFWNQIRMCFTISTNIINLNNGGVSPQPKSVQDAHIRYYEMSNEGPSFYMWRTLDQGREPLRQKLALLAGCDAEEIAINRNSTEGLNTIIFGLNLKAGDEVVLSKYDYPNMMNAWRQREKREGIVLKWIDPQLPFEDDNYIVDMYRKAIGPKTKVVHITHLINWTGQIVPAKKIADIAHEKGCEVIVDGAHSFAHVKHKISDTGADYYATSLHKWTCAPFGSGLLYIKKDKIKNIWALLSNDTPDGEDIRKFESLGTRSFASEMAISAAIDFHNMIGDERKEARLRYLKEYWTSKVKDIPGIKFYSPQGAAYSCAIANMGFEGWTAAQIEIFLFEKVKVHTVAITYQKVNGIRVTPHVYTSLADLDKLVAGIKMLSKAPIPG